MDPPSIKKAKVEHDFIQDVDMNGLTLKNEDASDAKEAKAPIDIAGRIVQAMGNRAINREFEDCSVIVDGTIFRAHSFVLISCSEFFRSRYRANLEENREMTFRLNNISASIFQLIIDILYTGENLLTEDNIKDFWNAVNQLQIGFLMKLCEDFVLSQLTFDNVAMYKRQADSLYSQRARLGILYFIMKNFPVLINSEVFFNLSSEDLKHVVESDDLVVESEDVVLNAIYAWVKANERERKQYLAYILQCTRYCQASNPCIKELSNHSFTRDNSGVKEIFNRALAYKLDRNRGDFWPTAAIYRESWGYEHVGVYCNTLSDEFIHISLKKNSVMNFENSPPLTAIKLSVCNDNLVACKETSGNIEIFSQAMNLWLRVGGFKLDATDKCLFMISHDSSIVAFSRTKMYFFDSNEFDKEPQEIVYDIASPKHALSFYNQILVFSGEYDNWLEETIVHAWSSETKTWSKLAKLRFTASEMTSFKDETNAYIIDQHGHFWQLTNTDSVVFTYIGKLWDEIACLTGALLFRKSLYVFVARLPSINGLRVKLDEAGGVFEDFKLYISGAVASNVVHILKERNATADAVTPGT